jgi:hypothetical protein
MKKIKAAPYAKFTPRNKRLLRRILQHFPPEHSVAALSKFLGIYRTTPFYWTNGQVPLQHVGKLAHKTGIPPAELRPDIYGRVIMSQGKRPVKPKRPAKRLLPPPDIFGSGPE